MNNFEIWDILQVLGLALGAENYRLNNQQSQALMQEMSDNQDSMLKKIIEQNELIIQQNELLLRQNIRLLNHIKEDK